MTKRFAFGPFLLDAARGTLTREGAAVAVGQRGLRILHALLEAGGEPVPKARLMDLAWPGLVVEDSNLSVQIASLRKLLVPPPAEAVEWIVTVPRLGYRLGGGVAFEDTELAPGGRVEADPGGRPGIAVLPFTHLGDDPAEEYFADGVAEALIIALTRFRWFAVTGRNSSHVYKLRPVDDRTAAAELGVRYLVEGSVRRSGERLRIAAQLVDAVAGRCLWADQHEFAHGDMFEAQDAIALHVAGAIEPELLKSAGSQAARQRRASVSAWDLVAQGTWLFHHVTQPTHLKARELFRQAARADAELTEAHLWLGRVNAGLVAYGWTRDPAGDLREGLAAALQAVQIDERNPYAHYALAIVSNYADDVEQARRSAEKAVALSPCFALGHLVRGMAELFSGDAASAAEWLSHGLRLNRYDPQNFVWYNILALACLFEGNAGLALEQATASLQVRPSWRAAMRTAAAANEALGRRDAAVQWMARWTQAAPAADALAPLWRCNPPWAAQMRRLAGPD